MFRYRVGYWPCPRTIDWAGKACYGQTLLLITKIRKLRTKKVLKDCHLDVVSFLLPVDVVLNDELGDGANKKKKTFFSVIVDPEKLYLLVPCIVVCYR